MNTLAILLLVIATAYLLFKQIKISTIFEYETGLQYQKGKFMKLLDPGQYWHIPLFTTIHKLDLRPQLITLPAQEILSQDGVTLKTTVVANYKISDPLVAVNSTSHFDESLYLQVQLALRESVGSVTIEEVLEKRKELGKEIREKCQSEIEKIGLELLAVEIKDISFPGSLKQTFAQVAAARQQGLADLERARGETAALRKLANAAKLLEDNPALMHLRTLQSLENSTGNSIVMNLSNGKIVPVKSQG